MSTRWQLGPEATPSWWNFVRQLVMFAAGVFTIVWVVVNPGHDVVLLVTGLVLIGLVPLENVLIAALKPKRELEDRLSLVEDQQRRAVDKDVPQV